MGEAHSKLHLSLSHPASHNKLNLSLLCPASLSNNSITFSLPSPLLQSSQQGSRSISLSPPSLSLLRHVPAQGAVEGVWTKPELGRLPASSRQALGPDGRSAYGRGFQQALGHHLSFTFHLSAQQAPPSHLLSLQLFSLESTFSPLFLFYANGSFQYQPLFLYPGSGSFSCSSAPLRLESFMPWWKNHPVNLPQRGSPQWEVTRGSRGHRSPPGGRPSRGPMPSRR